MERGESWYGLFDTMWWTTELKSTLLFFVFFFLFSFVQVGPNFCGLCPSSSPFVEKEDDECMCV